MATVADIRPNDLHGTLLFRTTANSQHSKVQKTHAEHHEPIGKWLDDLGLPNVVSLAMFQHDGRYLLAASQQVRDENDVPVWDHASDCMAATYRVLDLGTDATWPDILNWEHYRVEDGTFL